MAADTVQDVKKKKRSNHASGTERRGSVWPYCYLFYETVQLYNSPRPWGDCDASGPVSWARLRRIVAASASEGASAAGASWEQKKKKMLRGPGTASAPPCKAPVVL